MAILHQATLSPSKLEVLSHHLRSLPGHEDADPTKVSLVAAFRFDDPAGKVGIECHLIDDGAGGIVHVPLTYREAPLDGAEHYLLTTMEHSVLGPRWIYNACGDPVFVAELVRVIIEGDTSVELFVETADGMIPRPGTASAVGTGARGTTVPNVDSVSSTTTADGTRITIGTMAVLVRHDVALASDAVPDQPSLLGRWGDDLSAIVAILG